MKKSIRLLVGMTGMTSCMLCSTLFFVRCMERGLPWWMAASGIFGGSIAATLCASYATGLLKTT